MMQLGVDGCHCQGSAGVAGNVEAVIMLATILVSGPKEVMVVIEMVVGE